MTSSLGHFQSAFAAALLASEDIADPAVQARIGQPAFTVYRNTVMKGCIDALESNFPTVARLVGGEWFRAAAALHVAADPPRDGRLMHYGDRFEAFLAGFGPATDLVYLPGVARLDAMWCQAHVAADAEPLDAAWLARCESEALARLVVAPHPAARWAWFADHPVFSIWRRNRTDDADRAADDIAWHGEGALITRPRDGVQAALLDEPGCAFLDACACGLPLADAAEQALRTNPDADLAALLESLLRAGALTSCVLHPSFEGTS
ncbi:HvfC/BufC family peptide modification chaperone [Variovorax ureilyticus]|uniref:HvfC/BufC family peptide modification chaperone n=1 Tax=Variovorax ureilyticus TaxID=1836198 RepID=UPI003D676E06